MAETPDKTPTPTAGSDEAKADEIYLASQWRLMWWRFRRHHLAMAAGIVVILLYLVAAFSGFLSTGDPDETGPEWAHLPPQAIHFFDGWRFAPYVLAIEVRKNPLTGRIQRDPETYRLVYEYIRDEQTGEIKKIPARFLVRGAPYKLFGLIPCRRHLLGIEGDPERTHPYLLGTDKLGRDLWSRLMYGTRISMSIGLIGVAMSLLLGVTLGGISGYYGGWVDSVIQRIIEFIRSIPTIPLWMGLAAALPKEWSVLQRYFAVTVIISLIAWTRMARVVRGKFLTLREEDFVMAARLSGCSTARIIFRHMVPSFTSHIIAEISLAIPRMILSETALSFLGLGLRPPAISWGVLLQGAQTVQSVALYPWLLLPAVAVIAAVLSFNFLGDGLRDAADPYSK